MGRIAKLKSPVTIKDVYEKVKKHLGLEHLRLALSNIHMKGNRWSESFKSKIPFLLQSQR